MIESLVDARFKLVMGDFGDRVRKALDVLDARLRTVEGRLGLPVGGAARSQGPTQAANGQEGVSMAQQRTLGGVEGVAERLGAVQEKLDGK